MAAKATAKTEVESINRCATCMLFILKRDHNKNQYDPSDEDSVFYGNISEFFGNVDYDLDYRYHLCETDVLIDSSDLSAFKMLEGYADETIEKIKECNEEIDSMSEIVTIRLLVKERKEKVIDCC